MPERVVASAAGAEPAAPTDDVSGDADATDAKETEKVVVG